MNWYFLEHGHWMGVQQVQPAVHTIYQRGVLVDMSENTKIDVNKAFEAIAKIIGEREHMDIKVIAVREKDKKQEK